MYHIIMFYDGKCQASTYISAIFVRSQKLLYK